MAPIFAYPGFAQVLTVGNALQSLARVGRLDEGTRPENSIYLIDLIALQSLA
jgi:hypothetical protein